MYKVKTLETRNNTYHLGYRKDSKLTYEQQQEKTVEFRYMLFQKTVGTIATVISIIGLRHGLIPLLLTLIVGVALIFTNEHCIG
jgi:hypothetical protein